MKSTKTIDDVTHGFGFIFKELSENGWKQPEEGYADRFVLEHPIKGYTAHVLEFPEPFVGIISRSGCDLLGGGKTLNSINRFI